MAIGNIQNNPSQQTSDFSEALDNLHVFISNGKVIGHQIDTLQMNLRGKVIGEENYQWLVGNYFITGHWNRTFGDASHIGISILGYDAAKHQLFTNNYDNMGFSRTYTLEPDQLTWKFIGEKERASIIFSEDKKHFSENWEILKNDTWQALCELKATKIN